MRSEEGEKGKARGKRTYRRLPSVTVEAVRCPHCGSDYGYAVTKTLSDADAVRRYVRCNLCGGRFALITRWKNKIPCDGMFGLDGLVNDRA